MEILMLLVGLSVFLAVVVFTAFVGLLIFALGIAYGKVYHNGAERSGALSWSAFRALGLWRSTIHWYFGIRVDAHGHADEINGLDGAILYAHHPHGAFPVTVPVAWGLHGDRLPVARPGLIAATNLLMWLPVVREVALALGCINASRPTLEALLKGGQVVHVIPGGVREALCQSRGHLELYFGHKGFLRLAWETKATIVPVFDQGEVRDPEGSAFLFSVESILFCFGWYPGVVGRIFQ